MARTQRTLAINRVTGPASEPITVEEAKQALNIDHDYEDELIAGLISTARNHAEIYRTETLVTQKFELLLDRFPENNGDITIPWHPLVSVSSISYVDTSGSATTFAASNYTVATKHRPGIIALAADKEWPSTQDVINAVTVTFISGYATPASVNATANTLTPVGRSFTANEVVRLSVSGGSDRSLPTPLSVLTDYYVISPNSTIQLATSSGGSAIDITNKGSGQIFIGIIPRQIIQGILFTVAHLYEVRENVIIGTNALQIPMTAEYFLDYDRVHQIL